MEDLATQFVGALPENLQGGSAEAVSCAVSTMQLSDGTQLTPPAPGVTAIVGPNNAGKSTLLRELYTAFGRLPNQLVDPGRVLAAVELETSGDPADVTAWLMQHARVGRTNGAAGLMPLISGQQSLDYNFFTGSLGFFWSHAGAACLGSQLRPFFLHYADTETRLQQSRAAQARSDVREAATHPLHALEDDRHRLVRASELAEQVFGEPMHLDDYSGERRLKVGHLNVPVPARDSNDSTYRDALLALPELAEQGDGMRSFFGQLLPLLARSYPLVLVDEPEAFLHPPQAALLGRALGELVAESGAQLLLATHDRHLLSGLLQSGVDLSVVRIDRRRDGSLARQLGATDLNTAWSEPAVRYSNALDGLFHRLVILVEGDGDARFYAAALDAASTKTRLSFAPSDVLFVPCNGKGGMAKLARALVSVGVPVVASPDLDVLRDPVELGQLLEALGGSWRGEVSADYQDATASMTRQDSPLLVEDLLRVLPSDKKAPLDRSVREQVERLLRTTGGVWGSVKNGGIGVLGGGGTGAAAARLLDRLDQAGLVALREGELESLDHALSVRKSHWVTAALEAEVHKRDSATAHIRRLLEAGERR